jgi:hypothetical protein
MNQRLHGGSHGSSHPGITLERSNTVKRLNAGLIAAALALVPLCAGFSTALANAADPAAMTMAGHCCSAGAKPGCVSMEAGKGVPDACVLHCLRARYSAISDPTLPAATFADAAPAPVAHRTFPPHVPRLSAAPRATSSIPLIYQFHRLLN